MYETTAWAKEAKLLLVALGWQISQRKMLLNSSSSTCPKPGPEAF
jgi:hypothetical protein